MAIRRLPSDPGAWLPSCLHSCSREGTAMQLCPCARALRARALTRLCLVDGHPDARDGRDSSDERDPAD